jgi:hypothetical protein
MKKVSGNNITSVDANTIDNEFRYYQTVSSTHFNYVMKTCKRYPS